MIRLHLVLFLSSARLIAAYPTGPPSSACGDMTPGHGFSGQTSTPPYKVTTTATSGYIPGREYMIKIEKTSSSNTDFKGFMCQVRAASGSSTIARGTFESFDTNKAQNLGCTTSKGAVVHRNRNTVSSFSATWKAPSAGAGQLKAYCTVVQVKSTFWIKLESAPFDELSVPTTVAPTQPATAKMTISATTSSATTSPPNMVTTSPPDLTTTLSPTTKRTSTSKPAGNTTPTSGVKQSFSPTAMATKPTTNQTATTPPTKSTNQTMSDLPSETSTVGRPRGTEGRPTSGDSQAVISTTAWIFTTIAAMMNTMIH